MPEIPAYQSQGLPPETSRLPLANPEIVGGGEILQGMQRVQTSLLHLFQVQEQQKQADQITAAGQIYAGAKMKLLEKQQALKMAQQENPRNPMLLSQEYTAYAKQVYDDTMTAPEIQNAPLLKKYLSTHLATAMNSEVASYMDEQNKQWAIWDQQQSRGTLEAWRRVARANPAELPQAVAWISGKVATNTYTAAEGNQLIKDLQEDVNENIGMNFAMSHSADWIAARRQGVYPKGFDETRYSREQIARFHSAALEVDRGLAFDDEQARQADVRRLEGIYHTTDRQFMDKYLAHAADPKAPPLSYGDVRGAVATNTLDGRTASAYASMLEADLKEKALKTDNATYHEFFDRIALPWGDPRKITDTAQIYEAAAQIPRRLTVENVRQLVKDFELAKTPDGLNLVKRRTIFLDGQKQKIDKSNPLMGQLDPEGSEQFANFTQMALDEEEKMRAANINPMKLYDPTAKEYLGNRTVQYQKTLEESIETTMQNISRQRRQPAQPSTVEPRRPGETPQQYLDRTRK